MIAAAHVLFALAFTYLLRLPVVYAMVAAVLPDIDLLFTGPFPLAPYGVLHTPLFGLAVMAVLYLVSDREAVAAAYGIGHLSHLFLDTLSPPGVAWLYPVTSQMYGLGLAAYTDLAFTTAVIVASLGAVVAWRYGPEVMAWMR